MTLAWALWRDRRGEISGLRVVTLAVLVWPVCLAGFDAARGALGGRPLNDLIHRSGWWALIFLLASLAVTPLRRAAHWGKLIDVRRMIGVASFAYAAVHLLLYVVDQNGDLVHVATEIAKRLYLAIGFTALLGLAALGVTSNDTMVKRLGGMTWRRLHMAAYVITLLALVHYFQQTKADVSVPTLYAGLFVWLMGYRLLGRRIGEGAVGPVWLAGLSVAAGLLTLVGEAFGFWWSFGLPPLQFGAVAFSLDNGLRPGWSVMGAGLVGAALDAARGWAERRRPPATPGRRAGPQPARR